MSAEKKSRNEKQSSREELICLDELTLRDWAVIKKLAMEMLDAGQHGKDAFKCNIHAFLTWLITNEKLMVMEMQESDLKEMSEGSRFHDIEKPDKNNMH